MHEAAFIQAHARLLPVPLVPEIRLYLADESIPLWLRTAEALGRHDAPLPYWAFAWAGGQALARHILDNPAAVAGRTVLDLGAGSGLLSIAAMQAGAATTLAADIDRYATAAIALNSAANHVRVATTDADLLATTPASFAIILAGDLFFERPLAARALAFLERAHDRGAEVLVGDPRRAYFPAHRFQQVAEHAVPMAHELEDRALKPTAVWRLT